MYPSPLEGDLGCFQVLAIMKKAAIKTSRCRCLCGHKFSPPLGKYQGAWLLHHIVGVCLVLQETTKLSSKVTVTILHSHQQQKRSLVVLHPSFVPVFDVVCSLDFGHSNRCVVVSHYCFNLHFP